jgi:hypothetical protein
MFFALLSSLMTRCELRVWVFEVESLPSCTLLALKTQRRYAIVSKGFFVSQMAFSGVNKGLP